MSRYGVRYGANSFTGKRSGDPWVVVDIFGLEYDRPARTLLAAATLMQRLNFGYVASQITQALARARNEELLDVQA